MTIYRSFQPKRISQPNGKIPLPNKEIFLNQYQKQNKSRKDLAEIYGVHKGTIDNWCKIFKAKKTKEQQTQLALKNGRSFDKEGLYTDKIFDDKPHLKTEDGIFYIIRLFNDDESFYKFGITSKCVHQRFRGRLKKYAYEIIIEEKMNLYDAYQLEKTYRQSHKHISYKPKHRFAGHTECYISQDPETHAKVWAPSVRSVFSYSESLDQSIF